MRALLDTHAFVWWIADSGRLSEVARRAISDATNEILVSAATAWEVATKYRLGKLPGAEALAVDIVGNVRRQGFEELAITLADAERAGRLPGPHRDPFDRMLIAQAVAREVPLISADAVFDRYAVNRLW